MGHAAAPPQAPDQRSHHLKSLSLEAICRHTGARGWLLGASETGLAALRHGDRHASRRLTFSRMRLHQGAGEQGGGVKQGALCACDGSQQQRRRPHLSVTFAMAPPLLS